MLTVPQAAARMGISVRLLYDLVASGLIACYRVGKGRGKILFRPNDVDDYLAACRVEKKAAQVSRPRPPKPDGGFRHLKF